MEGDFPFRKLKHDTFLTLDVLMFVDYLDALIFMFKINKEARKYL